MPARINEHQKELLIELMKKNYKNMYGKIIAAEKNLIWTKIQKQLNERGEPKTTRQWKKCWLDIKKNIKNKIRTVIKIQQENGDGTITDKQLKDRLTESEIMIYNIIGKNYFAGDNTTEEYGYTGNTFKIQKNQPESEETNIEKSELMEKIDKKIVDRTPVSDCLMEAKATAERTNYLLEKLIAQQIETRKTIVAEQEKTRRSLKETFESFKDLIFENPNFFN